MFTLSVSAAFGEIRQAVSQTFWGPFAHGGTADRFLYLSWRPKNWRPDGPEVPRSTWLRRMKVRLGSITWSQIEQAIRDNGVLEIKVAGTGPSRPFGSAGLGEGWTFKRT